MAPVPWVTGTGILPRRYRFGADGASELGEPVDGRIGILERLRIFEEAAGKSGGERELSAVPGIAPEQTGTGVLAHAVGVEARFEPKGYIAVDAVPGAQTGGGRLMRAGPGEGRGGTGWEAHSDH